MPLIQNSLGEFVDEFDPYPPMKLKTGEPPGSRGRYEKTCPQCFRRFRTDSANKVYCSGACTDAARRDREVSIRNSKCVSARRGKRYRKTCHICGKEFTAMSDSRKYCSEGCKKAAESKRRKERKHGR